MWLGPGDPPEPRARASASKQLGHFHPAVQFANSAFYHLESQNGRPGGRPASSHSRLPPGQAPEPWMPQAPHLRGKGDTAPSQGCGWVNEAACVRKGRAWHDVGARRAGYHNRLVGLPLEACSSRVHEQAPAHHCLFLSLTPGQIPKPATRRDRRTGTVAGETNKQTPCYPQFSEHATQKWPGSRYQVRDRDTDRCSVCR